MGAFAAGGIAAEMTKFERMARGSEASCKKAVKAGGQLLAEKLSAAAPVRTGALAASIKAGAVKYSAADGYYCEVAPTGTSTPRARTLRKSVIFWNTGGATCPPDRGLCRRWTALWKK